MIHSFYQALPEVQAHLSIVFKHCSRGVAPQWKFRVKEMHCKLSPEENTCSRKDYTVILSVPHSLCWSKVLAKRTQVHLS